MLPEVLTHMKLALKSRSVTRADNRSELVAYYKVATHSM